MDEPNKTEVEKHSNPSEENTAKYAIDKLAELSLKISTENKKKFYIRIAFFSIILLIIFLFFALNSKQKEEQNQQDHIAIIEINTPIFAHIDSGAQTINPLIEKAFKNPNVKALFLLLNSPGGSAVQSAQIYDKIMQLKQRLEKPIYAFISDICTSGCYYIASSSDQIYAHRSSLVGSIGAMIQSFGIVNLLDKLGIENRSYISGKNKDLLSPFKPANKEQEEHITAQINTIHQQFISDIKSSRNNKLKASDQLLFNGLVWSGTEAKNLGLVDGLDYYQNFADQNYANLELVYYRDRKDWFEYLLTQVQFKLNAFLTAQQWQIQ